MAPCLMFGAFALLAAGVIIYSIITARQRRDAMAALAQQLGLQFYPDDVWDLPARYAFIEFFTSGHSRRASNILAGQIDGRDVFLFDYRYKTGSGKDEHTYNFQVALLGMPILAPRLTLRREGFLDTLASWIGHDDIDFESEEFSKRTCVKCEDRKFAYDIFHARLIAYLLDCGDLPTMEMNGTTLLVYDEGSDSPEGIQRLLTIAQAIIRSIPEYVLHDRGAGAARGGKP
jgi:hypothetical protein